MRLIFLIPFFSNMLIACNGDPGNTTPDAPPSATTIHITAAMPPALVVFRDGVAAAWQPATMKTPTSFEAEVHGPYIVAAVCDAFDGIFVTRQIGRTVDDPHDIDLICGESGNNRKVTGHMVQAGQVTLGPAAEGSGAGNWDFELHVPDGTYDLFAWSSDQITVRRSIAVNADLGVTPPVDVDQQGMPLAAVAFSAANAASAVQLRASVLLGAKTAVQLELYNGPIATAKVAPEAVLVSTDDQTVSLQATNGTAGRALRRPFRVGGDTTYTLPSPLGAVQWNVENGQLAVSWATTPALHDLFAPSLGLSADHTYSAAYTLAMSSGFVAATQIKSATFDTGLPGYKPEWKIDLGGQYHRELDFQRVESGQIMTIWDGAVVNTTPASNSPALPASRVYQGATALRR